MAITLDNNNFKRNRVIRTQIEASDISIGADTITLDIDVATLSGRTFVVTSLLLISSAGLLKAVTAVTVTYSTVTGLLSVTDTASGFATDDILTVQGYLKGQV